MEDKDLAEIRRLTREFLQKELKPHVEKWDEKGEFPREVYAKFAKTGLMACHMPEEYGGIESFHALSIVGEEMGRVDPGFALSVLASAQLFGYNVLRLGTPAQKSKYLKGVFEQGKLGCWALTEPDVGSDAVGIKTRAEKKGDSYELTGSKTFITNAPIADYFMVIAREYGEGIEGGTAFVIERGAPGMELSPPLKKMGHLTSPTGQIFFDRCKIPASQVLGKPGQAFLDMKHSLDWERIVLGGIAVGIMKECCDRSVKYAVERKQFGRSIAEFQLVQEHIAEMTALTDLAETYQESLWKCSEKELNLKAAIFKVAVADFAEKVTHRAVQVFGGNGYMREYFVEKLYRDVRLFSIGGGTSEINKLIVAKQALKKGK